MIGSILYSSLDYFWTFTILSLLILANCIYVSVVLSSNVDINEDEDNKEI